MEKINFVGLHAHSGVGSPFDGFGYPQDHMEFAYENGCEALASHRSWKHERLCLSGSSRQAYEEARQELQANLWC